MQSFLIPLLLTALFSVVIAQDTSSSSTFSASSSTSEAGTTSARLTTSSITDTHSSSPPPTSNNPGTSSAQTGSAITTTVSATTTHSNFQSSSSNNPSTASITTSNNPRTASITTSNNPRTASITTSNNPSTTSITQFHSASSAGTESTVKTSTAMHTETSVQSTSLFSSTTKHTSAATQSSSSPYTEGSITSTPIPTSATTEIEINYCEINPSKVCGDWTGPYQCSKGDDGNYTCNCVDGYYPKDSKDPKDSKNCIVVSSLDGELLFINLTTDLNLTVITNQIDSLNEKVPTYLYSTAEQTTDESKLNIISINAVEAIDVTVNVKIYLSELNENDESTINTNIQEYSSTCISTNCFGTNSSVNFTLNSATGPCKTTSGLCSNYPETECQDVYNNTKVQFQCKCQSDVTPNSTSYTANGGEIFVCSNDNCNPNPCKNGGSCFTASDRFVCSCPWTYNGSTCNSPLPLAMVIVSCILLVLTLLLIAALIYIFIKNKKSSASHNVSSGDRWAIGTSGTSHGQAGRDNEGYERPENIDLVGVRSKDDTHQSHF